MTPSAPRAERYPRTPWAEARLYRWPALVAIGCGLVGFPLGVHLLVASTRRGLGPADVALVQVHGTVQLLGWAGLFVVAVASHAVPRFFGNVRIPFPWPQRWTLVLVVLGLALRGMAQPGGAFPYRGVALAGAGVAVAAGYLIFAWTTVAVLHAGADRKREATGWFWLGVTGAAGTAILYVGLSVDLASRVRSGHALAVSPSWNTSFQYVALFGFLIPFAFGVSARAVAEFLRLPPRSQSMDRLALVLLATGTALVAAGAPGGAPPALGVLPIAVALAVFTLALGVLPRGSSPASEANPWTRRYVWTAYLWLLVAAVLMGGDAVGGFDTRLSARGRPELHLIAVGFLTTLILGFTQQALPLFEGRPLPARRAIPVAFCLLQAGVVLRLTGALAWGGGQLALGLGGMLSGVGFLVGVVPLLVLLVGRAPPPRTTA